jgi:hypothetical protein
MINISDESNPLGNARNPIIFQFQPVELHTHRLHPSLRGAIQSDEYRRILEHKKNLLVRTNAVHLMSTQIALRCAPSLCQKDQTNESSQSPPC